jgi:hypothetical protein
MDTAAIAALQTTARALIVARARDSMPLPWVSRKRIINAGALCLSASNQNKLPTESTTLSPVHKVKRMALARSMGELRWPNVLMNRANDGAAPVPQETCLRQASVPVVG